MDSDEPQEQPEPGSLASDWPRLVSVSSEIEANLLQGFLASEGVESVIEPKFFTQEPTNFSALGEFVLHVPAPELERARLLMEQRNDLEQPDSEELASEGEDEAADVADDGEKPGV